MRLTLSIFLFSALLVCCNASETTGKVNNSALKTGEEKDAVASQKADTLDFHFTDTTFVLFHLKDSVSTRIQIPSRIKGYLLILHGWNLDNDEICEKTTLCKQALDSGYVVITPDFGKTTYHWENYPETRKSWRKFPTRSWMYDTFLVELRNNWKLLLPGQRNFVYGVSTGGRGAALFALEKPEIFKAAACLSADFDHSRLKDEPINNGFYGPMAKFPERWTGKDNIHNRASEFKAGLYLAHGEKDKVCPVEQTRMFIDKLKKDNPELPVQADLDISGDHTYIWWGKKTSAILQFFAGF